MKIELRPLKQEKSSSCVPACLKLVLDHFGIDSTEEALAKVCRTDQKGTRLNSAAKAMRSQNLTVIELK